MKVNRLVRRGKVANWRKEICFKSIRSYTRNYVGVIHLTTSCSYPYSYSDTTWHISDRYDRQIDEKNTYQISWGLYQLQTSTCPRTFPIVLSLMISATRLSLNVVPVRNETSIAIFLPLKPRRRLHHPAAKKLQLQRLCPQMNSTWRTWS